MKENQKQDAYNEARGMIGDYEFPEFIAREINRNGITPALCCALCISTGYDADMKEDLTKEWLQAETPEQEREVTKKAADFYNVQVLGINTDSVPEDKNITLEKVLQAIIDKYPGGIDGMADTTDYEIKEHFAKLCRTMSVPLSITFTDVCQALDDMYIETEDKLTAYIAALEETRTHKGVSFDELANRIESTPDRVQAVLSGSEVMTADELLGIADGLGVLLEDVKNQAETERGGAL